MGRQCVFIKPKFFSFLDDTIGSGVSYFSMVPCRSASLLDPASFSVFASFSELDADSNVLIRIPRAWMGRPCVFIKSEFFAFLSDTIRSGGSYFTMVPCRYASLLDPASFGLLTSFSELDAIYVDI